MTTTEDLLEEDHTQTPQSLIKSRHRELKDLSKTLKWRTMLLPKLKNPTTSVLTIRTIQKSYTTSGCWYRRIIVKNVSKSKAEEVESLVQQGDYSLAANMRKTEDERWFVEIF